MLKGTGQFNTTIGPNYTKQRVNSIKKIIPQSITQNMVKYTYDMEYFDAYAENLQRISRLFTNKNVETIIKSLHGEKFYNLIDAMINKIATKGITEMSNKGARFFNFFNDVFSISRLALSPAIAIKQLTSIPTFMIEPEVGVANWFKYAAKNTKQQASIWKEVSENSVYLQDREARDILKTIETYNPERYRKLYTQQT